MAEYDLQDDTSWNEVLGPEYANRLDPNVRLVASLIDARDFDQLFRRTGLRIGEDGSIAGAGLPLFLDLEAARKGDTLARLTTTTKANNGELFIAPGALREFTENARLTILSARLTWDSGIRTQGGTQAPAGFRATVAALIRDKGMRRLSVPNPLQPCLEDSLADMEMPPKRQFNSRRLDGRDVVVGIVDDGCALAHRNFMVPGSATAQSRIRSLWDQARIAASVAWTSPGAVPGSPVSDGFELNNAAIDAALAARLGPDGLIDEAGVYADLDYEIELASHGTHVMDIAAGNGASLIGTEGVAPAADIIFVQLPNGLVESGGPALESHILDGVKYIFHRAAMLAQARGKPMPVVVNISYGGYSGPHDGSSPLAAGIDQLLKGATDRAVVVSAGNGFEADCHAQGSIATKASRRMQWILGSEDSTSNQLEIWYDRADRLDLRLFMPASAAPLPPVHWNERKILRRADGGILGWIENVPTTLANQPNVIRIQLNATVGEDSSRAMAVGTGAQVMPPLTAAAPSGTWTVELRNPGTGTVAFHAWIARDDLRRRGERRRQQSRFASHDADPRYTVADLATGHLSLCVGAHNTATQESCGYSACGPTRDGRRKPEVTAPAEEDSARRGTLCASSRRAQPSRFNGTSAAAPHAAGLVALMLQYNRDSGQPPMPPQQILSLVTAGAVSGRLIANRRQEVDPHRPAGKRQSDHFAALTGAGKADIRRSMP